MKKSIRASAGAIVIGALVLSGCTAGGDESADSGELDTLSIMVPFFSATAPEEGNEIESALEKLAGVSLDIRWVPNAEYTTQTNVVLAGDDVPDAMIIQNKTQGFVQTAEAGGFWDLTEYVESGDYPNLAEAVPEVQEAAAVNGKIYGLYRARDLTRQSVLIRQDWLDNLGLEMPETTEDLAEIARAFTEDDPDGNGEDDTYGLISSVFGTIGSGNVLDTFETWHGAGNMWVEEDGKLIPSWDTPEWRESLDYTRDLYASGYTNPDFATKDGTTYTQSFMNGDGGIFVAVSSTAREITTLLRGEDPEDYPKILAITGQLEGPHGRYTLPTPGYSGFLALSKASITDEAQLKKALAALDKLNSEEAQRLMQNGVEGENYELADGFAEYDPARQDLTDMAGQAFTQLAMNVPNRPVLPPAPADDYEAEIGDTVREINQDVEDAVYNPAAGLVAPTYITNQSTLDQIIADARIQYVVGEIDDAGLDDAVQRWRDGGGEQVIAEINELYAAAH